MPVMDGITATQAISAFESQNNLECCPIIAVTANAMEADRQACLEAGMSDFLAKPVRKAELWQLLQKWAAPTTARLKQRGKSGQNPKPS